MPISITQAWDFFSNPQNLKVLTPPWLNLQILDSDKLPSEIYPGLIIRYHVHPVLGIKNLWVTEITQAESEKYFIDEQRAGPYAFWHHQHLFHSTPDGVIMEDIIHYKPPLGFVGKYLLSNYVKKQLKKVFDHRFQKINEVYPGSKYLAFVG